MKLPLYGMIRKNSNIELNEIKYFNISNVLFRTFEDVVKFFNDKMHLNIVGVETAYILCLMEDGTPICVCEVSKGNATETLVSVNIIGRYLLLTGADRFVLIHNHTNNNKNPSEEDMIITNKIMELSRFLEVTMDDHIIICRNDWSTIIHKRG